MEANSVIATFFIFMFSLCLISIDSLEERNKKLYRFAERGINYTEHQSSKTVKYQKAISTLMKNQWTVGMGIDKEFIKDWYGTEIWGFVATHDNKQEENE